MMKNQTLIMSGLLACSLLAGNFALQAADPQRPNVPPGQLNPRNRPTGDKTDFLVQALKLTEDQKPKVKAVFDEETQKLAELRTNKELTAQDRQAKFREIRQATNEKLKPILTPEQWQKYQKNIPQARPPVIRTNLPQNRVTAPAK